VVKQVHWVIRRLTLPPGVALVSDVSSVVVGAYGYYDADINKINMKAIDLVGDYRSVGSTKALAVHNVTGDRHKQHLRLSLKTWLILC